MSLPMSLLYVLILLLTVLLIFDLLVVLLSFSILWYEYANTHPELVKNRCSRANLRRILPLLLPEFFFNFTTLLTVPFGLFPASRPQLKRGVTPTLLLHGLFVNRACWFWFRFRLKQHGCENIVTINLSGFHSEEVLTELLSKKIDELRHRLGVNKVNLVGHSMGGIIARNYVQRRGGQDKVDRLIFLGTPHQGSKLTPFSFMPLGKLLMPGSDFLNRLNNEPAPTGVRAINIYTRKDNMVLPNTSAQLAWGTQIELDDMGHTSLIYRAAAIDAAAAALSAKPAA
jgi:triacylglycerol esterase/lipase EstA (alpha/beta hydrolase family)